MRIRLRDSLTLLIPITAEQNFIYVKIQILIAMTTTNSDFPIYHSIFHGTLSYTLWKSQKHVTELLRNNYISIPRSSQDLASSSQKSLTMNSCLFFATTEIVVLCPTNSFLCPTEHFRRQLGEFSHSRFRILYGVHTSCVYYFEETPGNLLNYDSTE